MDVIGDAQNLPFKPKSFDTVLCSEVIEHVKEPYTALKEINRVLKKSGILILTAPHLFYVHERPNDYFRFTNYGLSYLLKKAGFKIISLKPTGGMIEFMGHLFSVFLLRITYFNRLLFRMAFETNKIIQKHFILKLDKVIDKEKRFARGYIVIARK